MKNNNNKGSAITIDPMSLDLSRPNESFQKPKKKKKFEKKKTVYIYFKTSDSWLSQHPTGNTKEKNHSIEILRLVLKYFYFIFCYNLVKYFAL
jgi:hypothetical protein